MKRGLKEGKGRMYHENETIYFQGYFVEGKIDGDDCKLFYDHQNLKFRGKMSKGIKCGYGCEYYENGTKYFEGQYINN